LARRAAFALAWLIGAVTLSAQVQTRQALPIPALPGYTTLKADLHLHTVFSDGTVWPTVHLLDAWRDGLDVLSLTEHVEYRPHARDVTTGIGRAHEIARPLAEELGMILIPGVEITKPASPDAPDGATAHFNALFVTDPAALDTPDLLEALRRARAQGAFVFWNHPGFREARAEWFPLVAEAFRQQLFQGMELVNGPNFYAEAYPWIEEKRLTILANSDAHDPLPPRDRGWVRPMTLIFARTPDAAGVHEALLAGRTAAWMGGELWGAQDQLLGIWKGAVSIETPGLQATRSTFPMIRVRNVSAVPFRVRAREAPDWFRLEPATIEAGKTSLLRAQVTAAAPLGRASFDLGLEITNLHIGPGRHLTVQLPVTIEVRR
jgi:3',5'-nucleoside bisphosphate phosphatase